MSLKKYAKSVATHPLIAALAVFAVLPTPALAQDNSANQYIAALKECRAQLSDAERLQCYDMAVSKIVAASDEGELRVIDRGDVRETRRKLFGFSLPDIGLFKARDDKDDELDVLESTITKASRAPNNGWLITTAEGAVWQISNVPARLMDPREGQSIEFKRAALGSFFVSINKQNGVKGRRVR